MHAAPLASVLAKLTSHRALHQASSRTCLTIYESQLHPSPFTPTRMRVNNETRRAEATDGSLTGDDYRSQINPTGQVPALKVVPLDWGHFAWSSKTIGKEPSLPFPECNGTHQPASQSRRHRQCFPPVQPCLGILRAHNSQDASYTANKASCSSSAP